MKKTFFSLALAGALAVSALAAVSSGLKPGAPLPAFQVVDVNGPNKGQQLCYRCQYGVAPVAAAFIKSDAPDAAEVVMGVQKLVDSNKAKGLKSFIVFMGGPELKGKLEKMASAHKVSVPLTFLPQGPSADDIKSYEINPEANSTVLLWTGGKVKANFANPTRAQWDDISKAAAKMLQ